MYECIYVCMAGNGELRPPVAGCGGQRIESHRDKDRGRPQQAAIGRRGEVHALIHASPWYVPTVYMYICMYLYSIVFLHLYIHHTYIHTYIQTLYVQLSLHRYIHIHTHTYTINLNFTTVRNR